MLTILEVALTLHILMAHQHHIIMTLGFSEIEPVYYEDFMDEKGMSGTGY